jgi:6-phosphogluconolactonase
MPATASFDPHERCFNTAAALTEALAGDIATALQSGLARGRGASLVVPGGRTRIALFERLAASELDWEDVWVTLTDERWVDPNSNTSNEHLVREQLLRQEAAKAQFVGLKTAAPEPRPEQCWSALADLPRPFDFVVLGMGDDGHCASLFPDSPGLAMALDPTQPPGCVAMAAPAPPRARISLNLRALLDSRHIAVLITGAAKWATYQRARVRGPVVDMPVRALTLQQNVPVALYWCP